MSASFISIGETPGCLKVFFVLEDFVHQMRFANYSSAVDSHELRFLAVIQTKQRFNFPFPTNRVFTFFINVIISFNAT